MEEGRPQPAGRCWIVGRWSWSFEVNCREQDALAAPAAIAAFRASGEEEQQRQRRWKQPLCGGVDGGMLHDGDSTTHDACFPVRPAY